MPEKIPFAEEQGEFYKKNREQILNDHREVAEKERDYESVLKDIDEILKTAKDQKAAEKIIEEKYKPIAQKALRERRNAENEFETKYRRAPDVERLAFMEEEMKSMEGKSKEVLDKENRDRRVWEERIEEIEDKFDIWGLSEKKEGE